MKRYIVAAFGLMITISPLIWGQIGNRSSVNFTMENDSFYEPENEDDNYTWGGKLEYQIPGYNPCAWLPLIGFEKSNKVIEIERYSFGTTGYTPNNLVQSAIDYNDRPYASFSYAGFGRVSINDSKKAVWRSEISLGLIGYRFAGDGQSLAHKEHWFGSQRDIPQGWHNQIGYPGTLGFNYFAERSQFLCRTASYSVFTQHNVFTSMLVNYYYGGNIGNYMINSFVGLETRLLNFNSDYFTIASPDVQQLVDNVNNSNVDKFSFVLVVRTSVKLVGHNSMLMGLPFNDNSIYTIPDSRIERILLEATAGVQIGVFQYSDILFSYTYRTLEFRGANERHHFWGSGTLVFYPSKFVGLFRQFRNIITEKECKQ